jgi:anthraniloyl-CoA monooxygenase
LLQVSADAAGVRVLKSGLVVRRLAELAKQDPALVAVYGGSRLTRTLLCEQARMRENVPALLVEEQVDPDLALTTILSGRADLVGSL